MRIAIFGATSVIAKDLQTLFARSGEHELVLYARRPSAAMQWQEDAGLCKRYTVADFEAFDLAQQFDAIMNFVGVGDPARAEAMGSEIFDVTLKFDELALSYLHAQPKCRYIFLSSGAAYGSAFDRPVDADSSVVIPINGLSGADGYAIAKLHAEGRHRALPHLHIVDIRVFNYFSRFQDVAARFFITDAVRAIQSDTVLVTGSNYFVRDYIHSTDLFGLVSILLASPPLNAALDCYSKQPIDKPSLLAALAGKFGLRYQVEPVDAVGGKKHYYSLNRRAAQFGYVPSLTSLQAVEEELHAILNNPERAKT